jgi:hypothetical protein
MLAYQQMNEHRKFLRIRRGRRNSAFPLLREDRNQTKVKPDGADQTRAGNEAGIFILIPLWIAS